MSDGPSPKITLEICEKTEEHGRVVFAWRSDPVTREMSFSSDEFTWQQFFPRFIDRYYLLKELPPLFACLEGKRVAFISFSPYESVTNACEVSIMVDPLQRGKGIGTALLKKIKNFLIERGYEEVYARIKPHNIASLKAFRNAGFLKVSDGSAMGWNNGVEKRIHFEIYKKELLSPKETSVFIIAEVGSNWRISSDPKKDLEIAKNLIKEAKEAGCDAVKFQTFTPEYVYVPNAGKSDYLKAANINEDILDLFGKISMPHELIPVLAEYCSEQEIEFMSTPFSPVDFHAVDPYVKRHKIASYEIGHVRLIQLVARSNKPVIMSTGASNLDDIDCAVEIFKMSGGKNLTLLQCTAQYPAAMEALNLRTIPWMRAHYGLPVGLSDHSEDPYIGPLGAVALGATVIEKHFTLDKKLPGPDHAHSVNPKELKIMVQSIRDLEKALGKPIKEIEPQEAELHSFAKRALQAIKPIKKGETFHEDENVAILRPGNQKAGVHPSFIIEIEGKASKRDIPLGDGVQFGDWER